MREEGRDSIKYNVSKTNIIDVSHSSISKQKEGKSVKDEIIKKALTLASQGLKLVPLDEDDDPLINPSESNNEDVPEWIDKFGYFNLGIVLDGHVMAIRLPKSVFLSLRDGIKERALKYFLDTTLTISSGDDIYILFRVSKDHELVPSKALLSESIVPVRGELSGIKVVEMDQDMLNALLLTINTVIRREQTRFLESVRAKIESLEELAEGYALDGYDPNKLNTDMLIDIALHEVRSSGIQFFTIYFTGEKDSELWVYCDGVLKGDGDQLIKAIVSKALGKKYRPLIANVVSAIIRSESKFTFGYEKLDPQGYLPLLNGILNLDTLELIPYPKEPDERFLFTYQVERRVSEKFLEDLKADRITRDYFYKRCPTFMKFLDRHYIGKDRDRIEDTLGSTIGQNRVKKLINGVGDPDTGKTTLANTLSHVLHPCVANVSLRELTEERFKVAMLRGKLVNITVEEKGVLIKNVEKLKQLTGGDYITAEEKHKKPFRMRCITQHILFSNNPPALKRVDPALLERYYRVDASNPVTPEEKDPELEKKLIEEADGIFEYILWCYWNLKKRNFIMRHELSIEKKYELLLEGLSNVYEFLKDKDWIIVSETGRVERKLLYKAYVEWCRLNGEQPVSRREFYEHVRRKYIEVKVSGEWYFKGIDLTEKAFSAVAGINKTKNETLV